MQIKLEENENPSKKVVEKNILKLRDMMPDSKLLNKVVEAVSAGCNIAIICNLVDDAQNIYNLLSEMIENASKVQLFHSRYTLLDRQKIEEQVLKDFGEDENRVKGKVIVSTQVIEQSLNVDFDWMITQLCPVDLLFQRIGRLHRFYLEERPKVFEQSICTVILPNEEFNFGIHSCIYENKRVLWRTAQLLLNKPNVLVFPDVYRPWVEDVYQEEEWNYEPETVTKAYADYIDQVECIKRMKARLIKESAMNPVIDDDIRVMGMTRDGEMSLTIIPFVKCNKGKKLLSDDVCEELNKNDYLETIYLNSVNIPATWKWIMDYLEMDDDGRLWFEMEESEDSFNKKLKEWNVYYSAKLGFRREKRPGT